LNLASHAKFVVVVERGKCEYAADRTDKSLLDLFHNIPLEESLARFRPDLNRYRLCCSVMGKEYKKKDKVTGTKFDINAPSNAGTFGAEQPPDIAEDDERAAGFA
jgi:hypothetical protein